MVVPGSPRPAHATDGRQPPTNDQEGHPHPMFTAYAAAVIAADAATPGSHLWEIVLAAATVGLIVATVMLVIITKRNVNVTAELVKVTADDAAKLANNSVDSMEHVAVEAIQADRHRAVVRLAAHRPPLHTHRRH